MLKKSERESDDAHKRVSVYQHIFRRRKVVNLRQISLAAIQFHNETGDFPESMRDLESLIGPALAAGRDHAWGTHFFEVVDVDAPTGEKER